MEKADLYSLDLSEAAWVKSSFSGDGSGDGSGCVEIAHLPGGSVALRDSRNPGREPLCFTADEWSAFRQGIQAGELQD